MVQCNTPKLIVAITKVVSNTVKNKRMAKGMRRTFKSEISIVFYLWIVTNMVQKLSIVSSSLLSNL